MFVLFIFFIFVLSFCIQSYLFIFIYNMSFNKNIKFSFIYCILFFTLILVCFVLIYYFVFVVLPVCPLRQSGLSIRCPRLPHEPRVRSGDPFKFHSQISVKEKINIKTVKYLYISNQKQTVRCFS